MQKDVFFCLLNDLRVKFWFLCNFWWKGSLFDRFTVLFWIWKGFCV